MASRSVDRLRPAGFGPLRAVEVFEVLSLSDDGGVIVSDGATERPMSCMTSYSPRAEGDVVMAAQLAGGSWVVLGSFGAAADVADAPAPVVVQFSDAAPSGGGWELASDVYVRDDGDGARTVHLTIGSATPPTNPATKVTITPSDAGGWRTISGEDSDNARAGSWSSPYGDWYGGFFYGTDIAAACSGKTVAAMTVTVSRSDAAHGVSKANVRLGVHDRATRGRVTLTNKWNPEKTLAHDAKRTIDIPSTQRALLAAGTAKGVGVYGYGSNDYLLYKSSSGVITITFS